MASLYTTSKKLKKEDIVLIFLSGHGVQKLVSRTDENGRTIEKEEPFFCPIDAHKNDVSTLLNMNDILKRLKDDSGASNNILLLDACRESLDKGKGIDGSNIENLPSKVTLFFAAQSGHRSFESRQLKHGIFTYYLLEGLRGKAAVDGNEITLQDLTSYVAKRVQNDSPGLINVSESEAQKPNFVGNLSGSLLLGTVSPSKAKVSLIPPGQNLSENEKKRRRELAKVILARLKLPDSDPVLAYVRGKVFGPSTLKFKLQNENDLVRYVVELQTLNQRTDRELYRLQSNKLLTYLKANQAEIVLGADSDAIRRTWIASFSEPKPSLILSIFSDSPYSGLPELVRPLLATTSEEQRKTELGSEFTDPVVLSLVGNYDGFASRKDNYSHQCYGVIAPVLSGDTPAAIKIADSNSDIHDKNLYYSMIVDTLLDEGRDKEARTIFAKIDKSIDYPVYTGAIPLPMFGFEYQRSVAGWNFGPYLIGRLGDEKVLAGTSFGGQMSEKKLVDTYFLLGLVSDL